MPDSSSSFFCPSLYITFHRCHHHRRPHIIPHVAHIQGNSGDRSRSPAVRRRQPLASKDGSPSHRRIVLSGKSMRIVSLCEIALSLQLTMSFSLFLLVFLCDKRVRRWTMSSPTCQKVGSCPTQGSVYDTVSCTYLLCVPVGHVFEAQKQGF